MKYIDADKLIAEIERRKKQDVTFRERNILIDIETAITSLQQEQLEVDLEKEIEDYIYTHDGRKRMNLELDWRQCNLTLKGGDGIIKFTSHFYELGCSTQYQKDRGEFAKLKAKEWQDGYDEGYAKGLNARKEE